MRRAQVVTAQSAPGSEPRYHPIAQYGAIGDCRTAALVAPNGSIDWCCLPHFDSPAVFCRLLDADRGGYFRLAPADAAQATMRYLDGTNMLETEFASARGRLRLVDCMPVRERRRSSHFLDELASLLPGAPHGLRAGMEREVGNDVSAAHRLLRVMTCLAGQETVALTVRPTFEYARQRAEIEIHPLGLAGEGAIFAGAQRYLVLVVRAYAVHTGASGGAPVRLYHADDALRAEVRLAAGQRLVAALNYARTRAEALDILEQLATHDFDGDVEETLGFWRTWSSQNTYQGRYQEAVRRSALALKLCTFEPTGAIIAAPTTSLPEAIGGVRNWDYRYTWLRDSAFTLDALGSLGYHNEARDYFHFIHDLEESVGMDLRVLYSVRGEVGQQLAEQTLDHLEGYRGSRPVRIGNGAAVQRQLDIYGELLDAAYRYVLGQGYRRGARTVEATRDLRALAQNIADYVLEHWQEYDRGIWEVRGPERAFVYSRAMCWVALDRACAMAGAHAQDERARDWAQAREAIHAEVLRLGYNAQVGSFTQAYGDATLDAANLRLPLVGFLPATDPRMRGTIEETMRSLRGPDGLIFRYHPAGAVASAGRVPAHQPSDDGLPGTEGAFLACTFWLINDLCLLGQVDEARTRFEDLLERSSPLGLFAEEIDPESGELLGNYPQAFTHIGLIQSAAHLHAAEVARAGGASQ